MKGRRSAARLTCPGAGEHLAEAAAASRWLSRETKKNNSKGELFFFGTPMQNSLRSGDLSQEAGARQRGGRPRGVHHREAGEPSPRRKRGPSLAGEVQDPCAQCQDQAKWMAKMQQMRRHSQFGLRQRCANTKSPSKGVIIWQVRSLLQNPDAATGSAACPFKRMPCSK